ncbi:MAG TPA: hypothetical protein VFC97_01450 [Verrucomicrobiae bacterium]|nr:hypothetical protein [Verrucomicrobiae bacterium]
MTEAARPLPGRLPGPRPAPTRTAGSASLGLVPPTAATRAAAPARRPIHVVVAVGMTAGLYAISLAGVAALQSASDLQLAADRAPAADAVAGLKSAHDAIEARLGTLNGAYAHAADVYQGIAKAIVGHEQALAALGQQVQAAAGAAAALSVPVISLAPAQSSGSASAYAGPATRSVAPAAGSRGSVPAGPAAAVSVPKPAPLPVVSVAAPVSAPAPVVHACTTASGKPC